jgi:hypothetical protein
LYKLLEFSICICNALRPFFDDSVLMLLLRGTAVLAAKDPEWFEKIDSLTAADLVALAEEFTKQQVAKVQHGE